MEYSGDCADIPVSRFSSRSASFRASSGRFALASFSVYSVTTEEASSISPSSFWMAFICWRRKYSRWSFSISSLASVLIFCPRLSTSFWCPRCMISARSFSLIESISRSFWASGASSWLLAAMRYAR